MSPPTPRGRLAPSPTGALHLGNIRTFMAAWLSIRAQGGKIILRIEDLDHPRHKPGAEAALLSDLRWLGFDWDEGPHTQSARKTLYRAALHDLLRQRRAYPCTCSRSEVETAQSAPHSGEVLFYPGHCRDRFATWQAACDTLPQGRFPAWRFRVDSKEETPFIDEFSGFCGLTAAETSGDFVFARDPDGAGYTLAAVVDDAAMRITEVIRGDDLLPATPAQRLLYRALNLTEPAFYHIPLVVGEDGRRLAKRHGDTRIALFREAGVAPERIIARLAQSCGWATPAETRLPLCALIERFNWAGIPPTPCVWKPTDTEALLHDRS